MNVQEIIKKIKEQILLCEQNGDMFDLPDIKNAIIEEIDLPNEGADLFHREYKISLTDGESIHIDYRSKDKCRTFQVNPDRSVVSVKCSRPELDFVRSWDENN